jgi:hypothetical protein
VATFRLKGQAATKHCTLLKIDWARIKTNQDGWTEYTALKKMAHEGVNIGCQHYLAGKNAEAKGAFAHAWQCRSACDWMFPPLQKWAPNKADPDGKKHAHAARVFEGLAKTLCTNEDGTPRAASDREVFEEYAKPFEKHK